MAGFGGWVSDIANPSNRAGFGIVWRVDVSKTLELRGFGGYSGMEVDNWVWEWVMSTQQLAARYGIGQILSH